METMDTASSLKLTLKRNAVDFECKMLLCLLIQLQATLALGLCAMPCSVKRAYSESDSFQDGRYETSARNICPPNTSSISCRRQSQGRHVELVLGA